MKGFRTKAAVAGHRPATGASQCGACGLYKHCNSPKMGVQGTGKRRILVVLPPITKTEDEQETWLRSEHGAWLRKFMRNNGIEPMEDCWYTGALICYTANPNNDQVDHCTSKIQAVIKQLTPDVIICLGYKATRGVVQLAWGKKAGDPERWANWCIPSQKLNAWIVTTDEIEINDEFRQKDKNQVRKVLIELQLREAFAKDGKPWKEVPNYNKLIQYPDEDKTVAIIKQMIARGGVVAFDYETNMLKPDHPKSRIYSCAICWNGRLTIAYPWTTKTAAATSALLKSDLWKIGANIKFEERWTLRHMGHGVNRWLWDTMQAAHCLDNRKGVTSVKFQSFVYSGTYSYNEYITQYLISEGSMEENKIHEIPLKKLLMYNGMDSLEEFDLALKQMEMMKHDKAQKIVQKYLV